VLLLVNKHYEMIRMGTYRWFYALVAVQTAEISNNVILINHSPMC